MMENQTTPACGAAQAMCHTRIQIPHLLVRENRFFPNKWGTLIHPVVG